MANIDMGTTDMPVTYNCSVIKDQLISSAARTYWLVAVLIILFIVAFFGNGILVVLFLTHKKIRDVNNALITNMAISDLLFVGLFVPILVFTEFYRFRPFGHTFCIISVLINYMSQDVSTFSLTALAFVRYRAVVRPFQSMTKGNSKMIASLCLFSWLTGAAIAVYPALKCEVFPYRECLVLDRHRVQLYQENEKFFIYFTMRFIFVFLTPFVIITYFYGRLAYTLLKGRPSSLRKNEPSQANQQSAARCRKRLTVVVMIIVATFFFSWLPTYVYWLTGLDDNIFIQGMHNVRYVTMFIPATTNPLILLLTSTSYQRGFVSVCLCRSIETRSETSATTPREPRSSETEPLKKQSLTTEIGTCKTQEATV